MLVVVVVVVVGWVLGGFFVGFLVLFLFGFGFSFFAVGFRGFLPLLGISQIAFYFLFYKSM